MVDNNNALKKYFKEQQCPPPYKENGFCHSYFFEYFNIYPSVLNIKHQYLTTIKNKNFHDPILIYVALYFYHNYSKAYEYFFENTKNGKSGFVNKSYGHDYNTACAVLNRWLDQQKNFYTHFGTCFYNLRWWNIYIEPLWGELEKEFHGKKCERYNSYYYQDEYLNKHKNISHKGPSESDRCYQQQPEDNVCFKKDDDESIKENCAKLSILFYLGEKYNLLEKNACQNGASGNANCSKEENIYYHSMLKDENLCFCNSLISTIALPIMVTVLGTIFLVFFLNEVIKTS